MGVDFSDWEFIELGESLLDLILISLWINLEDNSVSGFDLFEDLIRMNWFEENRVVVEILLGLLSNLGRNRFDSHWLRGSLLSGSSMESGFGSDLNSSLNFGVFDLGWFSLVS